MFLVLLWFELEDHRFVINLRHLHWSISWPRYSKHIIYYHVPQIFLGDYPSKDSCANFIGGVRDKVQTGILLEPYFAGPGACGHSSFCSDTFTSVVPNLINKETVEIYKKKKHEGKWRRKRFVALEQFTVAWDFSKRMSNWMIDFDIFTIGLLIFGVTLLLIDWWFDSFLSLLPKKIYPGCGGRKNSHKEKTWREKNIQSPKLKYRRKTFKLPSWNTALRTSSSVTSLANSMLVASFTNFGTVRIRFPNHLIRPRRKIFG